MGFASGQFDQCDADTVPRLQYRREFSGHVTGSNIGSNIERTGRRRGRQRPVRHRQLVAGSALIADDAGNASTLGLSRERSLWITS